MDRHMFGRGFFERRSPRSSHGSNTPNLAPLAIRLIHDKPSRSSSSSSSDRAAKNDDFYRAWDRFLARSPNRSLHTSALAKRVEQTQKAASREENGLNTKASPAASYEQAKMECQAKVQAIVDECKRLNQKYRDKLFDLDLKQFDCITPLADNRGDASNIIPSGVKRVQDIFEHPKFNAEGACGNDVMQGNLGNCWFIAALVSVSAKPGLMQRLCVARHEDVGVYGFVFFRDGEWIPEVIDDRLFLHVSDGDDVFVGKVVEDRKTKSTFNSTNDTNKLRESLQKGGEALFFSRCRDSSDTWLPLIEKAYAKAHGDYGSLYGGWVSEGTEDLTGGVSIYLHPPDIMDKQLLWESMKQVNDNYLFAGSARHYRGSSNSDSHAYAVLDAIEHKGLRLLKIRDPWGKSRTYLDGPFNHKFDEWNADLVGQLNFDFKDPGVFWVTFENFLKYFESIQRTRLFDETWTLTQQWSSVNVPPGAVTYLDTTFRVKLERGGPVVIVLCQPDVRYFQGLEGRYTYCLHFRVYKSNDMSRYIARSMHVSSCDYNSTRSVSVDLDLEAGSYTILAKITPDRTSSPTAEDLIEIAASNRKQKLLQIGRNFELANSKGKLREREEDNRRIKKQRAREEFRNRQAKMRKLRQKTKAREKKRRDRISEEKNRREKEDLMRRAGLSPVSPPPLTKDNEENRNVDRGHSCVLDTLDPNVELEDDDFEWDSEMDGEVFISESEEEKDWFEDDPWSAVCVLGLRVYSQTADVTITVCERGDQGDFSDSTPDEDASDAEDADAEADAENTQRAENDEQNGDVASVVESSRQGGGIVVTEENNHTGEPVKEKEGRLDDGREKVMSPVAGDGVLSVPNDYKDGST